MEACVVERLTPRTDRGSSLAHRVVSLDKELYSTLSLFTQVYKWVPATYCWGVTLRWTSILSRGEVAVLRSRILHATETGISSGCLGLWLVCAFNLVPRAFPAPPPPPPQFFEGKALGTRFVRLTLPTLTFCFVLFLLVSFFNVRCMPVYIALN